MGGSSLEAMADWAAGLEPGAVPRRIIDRTRAQVVGMVGGALGGRRSPGTRAIREATGWGGIGAGPATVAGEPVGASPRDALLANAAAGMAFDEDDYLFMAHTGHSAVWTALAAAEAVGEVPGSRLLAAVVAANEVGGRLGASLLLGPHNGQMWALVHGAAAAVAAGRVLRVDGPTMAHGIAIALAQPPWPLVPGFMGPGSKLLTAARPAADGLLALRSAVGGLTGPLDVLEADGGVLDRFAYRPLPGMLGGLGDAWVTDTLAIKASPGCAYLLAAVDALDEALDGEAVAPADPESIRVEVPLPGVEMDRLAGDPGPGSTPVQATFSLRLGLAIRAVAGAWSPEVLGPDRFAPLRDRALPVAARVEVRHDPSLTIDLLDGLEEPFGGRGLLRTLGPVDLARVVAAYRRDAGARTGRLLGLGGPRPAVRSLGVLGRRLADLVRGLWSREEVGLAGTDLRGLVFPFGARVRVRLRDGTRREVFRRRPPGAGPVGANREAARSRLVRNARGTDIDPDAVFAAVEGLEEGAVGDLTEALRG